MSYTLTYRFEAEIDLIEIETYYNKISPELTKRFFAEFFETLKYIEQEPNLFQIRYRKIRIAPLYRFPYGIHYRETNKQIVIFRVLHTKRYFK
ncbi:MAG: Plasmid stabilization system protein [Mucilaginibacter sp.]|nr:Plasmid stabilization system protein [Mucilaginibacter sp.]